MLFCSMLRELRIKNLAIIDDISIDFGKGLNILTGETGAGKSIIIDALGLAMGARASGELVRSGADNAVVEVLLDSPDKIPRLAEMEIDHDEGIIIKRIISVSGKSRAYINGSMVNNQILADVAAYVIDIHGQFAYQGLLSSDNQLHLLNVFGGLIEQTKDFSQQYSTFMKLKKQLEDLELRKKDRASKIELLTYQIEEIETVSLRPEEDGELQKESEILFHMGRLMEKAHESHELLYSSESSCINRLSQVLKAVTEIASLDERAQETLTTLTEAHALVQDASHFLRDYKDSLDFDPQRLDEIEQRLELIKTLKRKYGSTINEILEFKDKATEELEHLMSLTEKSDALVKKISETRENVTQKAKALSSKRQNTARKIESLVVKELAFLAMKNAQFSISFFYEKGEDTSDNLKVYPTGIDKVEYLISPNVGEPLKPLSKIASGGELSRIMLALKGILSREGGIPTLVFDEVDAGVGGKTAESVGQRLKKLSSCHQVICITHLPQIAVFGNNHIKIEKKVTGQRTTVVVKKIKDNQREQEFARMLSGRITEASLLHARDLIHHASSE
jgi:DNA repair protein RecN (Recombination protein N)